VHITIIIGGSNSKVRFVFRRVAHTTAAEATGTQGAQFTLLANRNHVEYLISDTPLLI
jgi:hypothetical protein